VSAAPPSHALHPHLTQAKFWPPSSSLCGAIDRHDVTSKTGGAIDLLGRDITSSNRRWRHCRFSSGELCAAVSPCLAFGFSRCSMNRAAFGIPDPYLQSLAIGVRRHSVLTVVVVSRTNGFVSRGIELEASLKLGASSSRPVARKGRYGDTPC
ncbi:hypothetical protein L195_g034182, partial [Trifolium pratense]